MSTRLNELTETQILEEIRKNFEGESMNGIDKDAHIEASGTLEELIIKIRAAIDVRNANHPAASSSNGVSF